MTGTDALVFEYRVASGDDGSRLDFGVSQGLKAGTIADAAGNPFRSVGDRALDNLPNLTVNGSTPASPVLHSLSLTGAPSDGGDTYPQTNRGSPSASAAAHLDPPTGMGSPFP